MQTVLHSVSLIDRSAMRRAEPSRPAKGLENKGEAEDTAQMKTHTHVPSGPIDVLEAMGVGACLKRKLSQLDP